jgi:flagellar basal body-associated protein FliL
MQDFGQRGIHGGSSRQTSNGGSKARAKKKLRIAVIIIIALFIIGIVVIIAPSNIDADVTMEELKSDYDPATSSFRSYDEGDMFTVTGKITTEIDYGYDYKDYVLDDVEAIPISSTFDLGNEGDTIYIRCRIDVVGILNGTEELLKFDGHPDAVDQTLCICYIILGVGGIILVMIGYIFFIELKKESRKKDQVYYAHQQSDPNYPQYPQQPPPQEPYYPPRQPPPLQ